MQFKLEVGQCGYGGLQSRQLGLEVLFMDEWEEKAV